MSLFTAYIAGLFTAVALQQVYYWYAAVNNCNEGQQEIEVEATDEDRGCEAIDIDVTDINNTDMHDNVQHVHEARHDDGGHVSGPEETDGARYVKANISNCGLTNTDKDTDDARRVKANVLDCGLTSIDDSVAVKAKVPDCIMTTGNHDNVSGPEEAVCPQSVKADMPDSCLTDRDGSDNVKADISECCLTVTDIPSDDDDQDPLYQPGDVIITARSPYQLRVNTGKF